MMISATPVNVAGFVVQAAPDKRAAVREALERLAGVDVHGEAEGNRLIATAIDTGDALAIDQLATINRLPGVITAMLAYHEIDHPEAAAAPVHGCDASSPCTCSSERV